MDLGLRMSLRNREVLLRLSQRETVVKSWQSSVWQRRKNFNILLSAIIEQPHCSLAVRPHTDIMNGYLQRKILFFFFLSFLVYIEDTCNKYDYD